MRKTKHFWVIQVFYPKDPLYRDKEYWEDMNICPNIKNARFYIKLYKIQKFKVRCLHYVGKRII